MSEYFECKPNCAKCCPGVGEIAAPVTIGDLYRIVHFLGEEKNIADIVMNSGRFDFCVMSSESVDSFCEDEMPKGRSYAIPSLAAPCFLLDMETKKCQAHEQSIRPVHCFSMPERDFAINPPTEEYFETLKGKTFDCIRGKRLRDADISRAILINNIAEAERGLTALLFPQVSGVSEGKIIQVSDLDRRTGEGFYVQMLAQCYNNPERRGLLNNFLRYTSNNLIQIIGEPDLIPENYEMPMPGFDISRLDDQFDEEQKACMAVVMARFTAAFEELKRLSKGAGF